MGVLCSKACGATNKANKDSLIQILAKNVTLSTNKNIKIWSILCIAKIWQNFDQIKGVVYDITDILILQLSSQCIEVRAVTMFALGTFFNLASHSALDLSLGHQLTKLVHDPSPLIRMELVFVLSSLIYF